jgi:hypothetical protein
MGLRSWLRTPTSRALTELRAEVKRLTRTVQHLEARQRKDTEQIQKLRSALEVDAAASKQAMHAAGEALRQVERDRREDIRRTLDALQTNDRAAAKWRRTFSSQLSALMRHACLPFERLDPSFALNAKRFRLRSQHEEDGVLFAVLDRAGWRTRRFVEIGAGRSGGTAAALAYECGWAGLMLDLRRKSVAAARRIFSINPGVTIVEARVTPANVNDLLTEHGYTGEVDLLSIDIDSYDYWILEALTVVSPRVLVLEYNAHFGPARRVTIPADQPLDATPRGYSGASLAALAALARRKGYRLVACEDAGVNAFFVRDGLAPDLRELSPAEAFKPLKSRRDEGAAATVPDIYATLHELGLPLVDV